MYAEKEKIYGPVVLKNPIIIENGSEFSLDKVHPNKFSKSELEARQSITDLKNGLYKIERSFKNLCKNTRTIKIVTEMQTLFKPEKYLMPGILYNGNIEQSGESEIPSGLTKDGVPWIFSYDRMGIPSCTLTENAQFAAALFASDENYESLVSAASIIKEPGGTMLQRIYHPVTEAPYTYSGKRKMTPRLDTYLTLKNNETVKISFYIFISRPETENFGFFELIKRCPEIFEFERPFKYSLTELKHLGISFLKQMLVEFKDEKMIVSSYDTILANRQSGRGKPVTPQEMIELSKDRKNLEFYLSKGDGINSFNCAIGFSSQCFLSARMLIKEGYSSGDSSLIKDAINVLLNFIKFQNKNGLINPSYKNKNDITDVCHMGQGISELAKTYMFLKNRGRVIPEFYNFIISAADFFEEHFSQKSGFGNKWRISDGKCLSDFGCAGGFIVYAMAVVYIMTNNEKYLNCAKKSLDYYYSKDINHFRCTAGAIDCSSVDRESVCPFLAASILLYEITKEERYIDYAKKAAAYLLSWMFWYDVPTDSKSDFSMYDYHTTGATSIAAEHNAIDPYAVIEVPDLLKLHKITGENLWKTAARMIWYNGQLGISDDKNNIFHGIERPYGGQSEAFFQTRWTKYKPTCEERGHFVDFLPIWVSSFRLSAIDELENIAETEL